MKKKLSKWLRALITGLLSAIILSIAMLIESFGFKAKDDEGEPAGPTTTTFIVTFVIVTLTSWVTSIIVAAVNKAAMNDKKTTAPNTTY